MATKKSTRAKKPVQNAAAPKWSEISDAQKRRVAAQLVRRVRAMASAGRYKIVTTDANLREPGITETQGEDFALDAAKRGRLLDLARNQVRNSSTFNSILKQFDLNGVGTCGGKATFTFADQNAADRVRSAFARFTRDADFFDGISLNTFLKVALKTYILGGDMVILFDDGLVEDSGRLLIYEPDEIVNLSDADLAAAFGASSGQSLGRVYSANGRFIGVTVSRSARGSSSPVSLDKCYTLHRDPNASSLDSSWIMPRNVFRIAQGRGIAPSASGLSTVIDLEDLTNYELQAAKKNSQTLAQVVGDSATTEDPALSSAFAPGTDFSAMTDAEINAAAATEGEFEPQVVTLDQIRGAGVLYESMPDGRKLELLDTKHPNANMPEFIRWLAGRSAAPFGLGSVYATLKADASYTAFRGEQVMSWPAFEEAQKFLESICDWVLHRWTLWAIRKGIVDAADIPEGGILRFTSWQWPRMREVNQVDEQNAIAMKLRNGTGSYLEIYGANWEQKLAQIAKEVEACKRLGLVHPQAVTTAGAVIESDITTNTTNTKSN